MTAAVVAVAYVAVAAVAFVIAARYFDDDDPRDRMNPVWAFEAALLWPLFLFVATIASVVKAAYAAATKR